MNITEHARYEAAVKAFMAREGVANLASGHHECPDCKQPFDDAGNCRREDLGKPTYSAISYLAEILIPNLERWNPWVIPKEETP